MNLAEPRWLLLLLLLPLIGFRRRRGGRVAWPSLDGFTAGLARGLAPLGWLRPALLALAFSLLIIALAGPRSVAGRTRVAAQGVAIVVALDRSSSMDAIDFPAADSTRVARFVAAKQTLQRFIAGRPDDLIGLVAFANYPDLVSPLTLDHGFLREVVHSLRSASDPGEDGTNMGDAVLWGLETLRSARPESKVLVLLTDGENRPQGVTPAPIDPMAAARLAGELGVTLHVIAIGQAGLIRALEPLTGLELPAGESDGPNVSLLEEMARVGGGRAFTASDARGLDQVFAAIDRLEASPIEGTIRTRYHAHTPAFLMAALGLLGLERLLAPGRLRSIP